MSKKSNSAALAPPGAKPSGQLQQQQQQKNCNLTPGAGESEPSEQQEQPGCKQPADGLAACRSISGATGGLKRSSLDTNGTYSASKRARQLQSAAGTAATPPPAPTNERDQQHPAGQNQARNNPKNPSPPDTQMRSPAGELRVLASEAAGAAAISQRSQLIGSINSRAQAHQHQAAGKRRQSGVGPSGPSGPNGPEPAANQQQLSIKSHGDAVTDKNGAGPTGAKQNICAACSRPIRERYLLVALDKKWHEDCLKCACCDCRLGEVGSSLFTHSDKILCRRDFLRIFGQHGLCAACKRSIPPYEMVMRANENAYHMDCFACQQCQYRFCVGDRFHLTESHRVVCVLCHGDQQQQQQQQAQQAQLHLHQTAQQHRPPASSSGEPSNSSGPSSPAPASARNDIADQATGGARPDESQQQVPLLPDPGKSPRPRHSSNSLVDHHRHHQQHRRQQHQPAGPAPNSFGASSGNDSNSSGSGSGSLTGAASISLASISTTSSSVYSSDQAVERPSEQQPASLASSAGQIPHQQQACAM